MKCFETKTNSYCASPSFSKSAKEWMLSSALYDGIEDEDIRQIQTLLATKGANPNVLLAEYGISPFHLAVANESTDFAIQATDICLQHGADPNVRSEDGLTPVHLATMWGCKEVLQLLLASGGDPWLVDVFSLNAFDYALNHEQHECYKILQAHTEDQHRPPPYKLNLKRVILYNNDLQIVYDASPSCAKCAPANTTRNTHSVECSKNGSEKKALSCTIKHNVQDKKEECKIVYDNIPDSKENRIPKSSKNNVFDKKIDVAISNRLKEVIVGHRRNSQVFEYTPNKEQEKCESEQEKCESTTKIISSFKGEKSVSALVEILDKSSKIRQSMKSSEQPCDLLKNVTLRKKPLQPVPSSLCVLTEELSAELGQELEESVFPNSNSTSSIGNILDNISGINSGTLCSSLFSDISSGVEANNKCSQKADLQNIDDIMTEDDTLLTGEHCLKRSLNNSTFPYVSCIDSNTSEVELSECFESCLENLPTDSDKIERSVLSDGHSLVDSILNNAEATKMTPVNHNLVSSTPERLSCASEKSSTRSSPRSYKLSWVEAKIQSSGDEDPYMSISEEYEYTDLDEGIVLIEKRHLCDGNITRELSSGKDIASGVTKSSNSEESEVLNSGSEDAYDSDKIRESLQGYGFPVGPITKTTKLVYLRQLKRLRHGSHFQPPPEQPAFSAELVKTLQSSCEHLLYQWAYLEDSMSASFACKRRHWPEGHIKTSFTYLLLDPTLLPSYRRQSPFNVIWPHFLRAVFYVGKGKRTRPYAHLYKAVTALQERQVTNSAKIQRILDIWNSEQGVVCLHVFHNIIPAEALTREAAMISALTLQQLTNKKAGEYHGSADDWDLRRKRRLGCVLLHRACQVFLAEGERQLRPADIGKE